MRGITSIALPYFLCESVKNICKKYNVNIRYYSLKDNLMPEDLVLKKDEWLYVVNYYGQIDSMQVKGLSLRYEHIIVDYAQAYFDYDSKKSGGVTMSHLVLVKIQSTCLT